MKNQFKLTNICEIDSDSVRSPERKELRYGRHYIIDQESEWLLDQSEEGVNKVTEEGWRLFDINNTSH